MFENNFPFGIVSLGRSASIVSLIDWSERLVVLKESLHGNEVIFPYVNWMKWEALQSCACNEDSTDVSAKSHSKK